MKVTLNTYLELDKNNINIRTDLFDQKNGDYLKIKGVTNINNVLNNEQKKIFLEMVKNKIKELKGIEQQIK